MSNHPAQLRERLTELRKALCRCLGHKRGDRLVEAIRLVEIKLDKAGCQRDDFCNCGCNALT